MDNETTADLAARLADAKANVETHELALQQAIARYEEIRNREVMPISMALDEARAAEAAAQLAVDRAVFIALGTNDARRAEAFDRAAADLVNARQAAMNLAGSPQPLLQGKFDEFALRYKSAERTFGERRDWMATFFPQINALAARFRAAQAWSLDQRLTAQNEHNFRTMF